jgi:hypothetical protein
MIIVVPHKHLFERKPSPPSHFVGDHIRFYTSFTLLKEIDDSLPLGGFRIVHLKENDDCFDYSIQPRHYPTGCFDIELVLRKIRVPDYAYNFSFSAEAEAVINFYATLVADLFRGGLQLTHLAVSPSAVPLPPFFILRQTVEERVGRNVSLSDFKRILIPLLSEANFDEQYYLRRYNELAGEADLRQHYIQHGYFENREAHPSVLLFG